MNKLNRSYSFSMLLMCVCSMSAHEFMHIPKVRRVSLQKMKEQAADLFSEQLRLTAEIVQSIGSVEVIYQASQMQESTITAEIKQLKEIGARMHHCRTHYTDLLAPMSALINPFDQGNLSLFGLLGSITERVGVIQQRIIGHVQDIFEDKGSLFTKQHMSQLPEVIKIITLYTDDFKSLKDVLSKVEKKIASIPIPDAPSCVISVKEEREKA